MSQSPPPISHQRPRKKRRWGWILLFVFLVGGLLVSLLVNGALMMTLIAGGHSFGASEDYPADQHPEYDEEWSYGYGDQKVVRLALNGVIARETEGGLFTGPVDLTESLLSQIRAAHADTSVRGLILEVDSPGGMIGPSDEIYNAVMQFRAREDQPKVVVFTRDLAASGGYYVGVAGDWFIAEPTAVVGSIGVIMQSINMKGLSEKIGVTDVTIKSGENKDLLNPFKDPDPAQLGLLQDVIDDMYKRFRNIVAERRGIADDRLSELADGRIFSADHALAENLIDGIGYWSDVVQKVEELIGGEVHIVRYVQEPTFWDLLAGVSSPTPAWSRLVTPPVQGPRFMYLWHP